MKDSTGVWSSLVVFLIKIFTVGTSHDIFELCWSCIFLLGVVCLCMLLFSEEKIVGFGVELDGDFFVFPFCIDF